MPGVHDAKNMENTKVQPYIRPMSFSTATKKADNNHFGDHSGTCYKSGNKRTYNFLAQRQRYILFNNCLILSAT